MHSLREDMSFNAIATEPDQPWWKFGGNSGMRGKIIIALIVSIASGGYAASLTSTWLQDQRNRFEQSTNVRTPPAPEMQKIVVASQSVKHGEELTPENTKIIDWAAENLPPSAFQATKTLFSAKGKRYALGPIEPNEPILSSKITDPGKRASLSAQLTPGKKAVTIRVDDVLGVGGLIVPNDEVDILWTNSPKDDRRSKEPFTAMLIPGVRVLALDQTVTSSSAKARVARTITVEVDTRQAQKVALATQTGKLHLALRSHGNMENKNATFQRVSLSNLGSNSFFGGIKTVPVSSQLIKFNPKDVTASIPGKNKGKKPRQVTITRGLVKEKYDVITTSSL